MHPFLLSQLDGSVVVVPQALASTLPNCTQLRILFLNDNKLGAAGAEALMAALPRCAALQQLHMERCGIDEKIQKALRKAWADNGKHAHLLYL